MFVDESFLNQIVNNHRRAIRYYLLFAIGIFVLGIAVITAAVLWQGRLIGEGFEILLRIGGGFVSSLSAFQLKEIVSRKEKVAVLETLKIRVHKLEEEGDMDRAERGRIEELLWKLVEKAAMG